MNIPHKKPIELYHYAESLCSQKVRVALAEKGLDYVSHHIMLCDVSESCENLSPEYLAVNPKGIVPTLVHEGQPVYDAHRQIRYLEEQFPGVGQRLWPETPELIARAEYWFDEGMLKDDQPMGSNFGTSVALFSRHILSYLLNRQPKSLVEEKFKRHPIPARGMAFIAMRSGMQLPTQALSDAAHVLVSGLRSVSDLLVRYRGPWLLGQFSMLDVTMMACFHRLQDLRLNVLLDDDSFPQLGAYWARLQGRSSYQDGILSWHDEAGWRDSVEEIFPDGVSPDLPLFERAMRNREEG